MPVLLCIPQHSWVSNNQSPCTDSAHPSPYCPLYLTLNLGTSDSLLPLFSPGDYYVNAL